VSFRLGILFSRIRLEEKLLIEEAMNRGIEVIKVDSRQLVMNLNGNYDFDILLERDVSHSRALYALNLFKGSNVKTINTYEVALICGDKVATTKVLEDAGVPTPETRIAFTFKTALQTIEEMGYPVVMKPVTGSWGRLLAKINDRDAAEALLEHKEYLGSYYHSIFYIQKYIDKPSRDIRVFVVGDEVICAIYRTSEHWITNTARGAKATNCPVIPELKNICIKATKAVGGGVLAVDLLETSDGFLVNEINYTIEFRNSIEPTNVNIPARVIDYVYQVKQE